MVHVNPISASGHFFLVVSFCHTLFRLDDLNVSIALSACLGCAYDEIDVKCLSDRVFKFSVCSKLVGIFINNLKSSEDQQFKCYFHLWGFGGPNWQREKYLWCVEQRAKWVVSGSSVSIRIHICFG
jgi:hypothetical protein